MSAVAHFFVAVSGSFIHERMAQLFVDIYTIKYANVSLQISDAIACLSVFSSFEKAKHR